MQACCFRAIFVPASRVLVGLAAALFAISTPQTASAQTESSVALLRVDTPSIAAEEFRQSLIDAAMAGTADAKNLPILPETADSTELATCGKDCRALLKQKHFTHRFLAVKVIASGPNYEVRAVFVDGDKKAITVRGTCAACAADEIAELVRSTVSDVLLGNIAPSIPKTTTPPPDTTDTPTTSNTSHGARTPHSQTTVDTQPSSSRGWIKWTAAATSVALVPTGIILWQLHDQPDRSSCPQGLPNNSLCPDKYNTKGLAITSFVISGALAATAAWLFSGGENDDPRVTAAVGGDSTNFGGTVRVTF